MLVGLAVMPRVRIHTHPKNRHIWALLWITLPFHITHNPRLTNRVSVRFMAVCFKNTVLYYEYFWIRLLMHIFLQLILVLIIYIFFIIDLKDSLCLKWQPAFSCFLFHRDLLLLLCDVKFTDIWDFHWLRGLTNEFSCVCRHFWWLSVFCSIGGISPLLFGSSDFILRCILASLMPHPLSYPWDDSIFFLWYCACSSFYVLFFCLFSVLGFCCNGTLCHYTKLQR